MIKFARLALAAAVAAAAFTPLASASAASPEGVKRNCFFVSQWRGWKSPSPRVLYLGVNLHDIYQVDLAADAPMLQWSSSRLISVVRGSSSVCSTLDLDLKVSDGGGIVSPLFPKSIRKLTPEEVAMVPAKYRPN